MTTSMFC